MEFPRAERFPTINTKQHYDAAFDRKFLFQIWIASKQPEVYAV